MWSLRKLSPRNLPSILSSIQQADGAALVQQYYGELDEAPRLSGRIDGLPSQTGRRPAEVLLRMLNKDFVSPNMVKANDVVVVDIPAQFLGRRIFSFKSALKASKSGERVVFELKTAASPNSRLPFWTKTSSCRVVLTAAMSPQSTLLTVKTSSVNIGSRELDLLAKHFYDGVRDALSTEIKIAGVHQKWLERSSTQQEELERQQRHRDLQDIINPTRINRLTAAARSAGKARYSPGPSLKERRNPKRGG